MGSTDVTIWLHNMACQLNDSRLLECEQDGEVMCRHLDDAAVSCLGGITSKPAKQQNVEILLLSRRSGKNSNGIRDSIICCKGST